LCRFAFQNHYVFHQAALKGGMLNMSVVDRAVSRILAVRFRLGLMDPASLNPYTAIPPSVVDSIEHRALALRAARESVVLLTNPANSLPLSLKPRVAAAATPSAASGEHPRSHSAAAELSMANAGATSASLLASASAAVKVAVVGPNANVTAFGNYNGNNRNASTVYEGILRYVPHASYTQGCSVATNDTSGIAGAIATASTADVVVAVLGIDQSQEHETGTRTDVVLPGVQPKLLEALVATGKPIIVVLMGGSAMAVQYAAKHAAAMLWVGCVNQSLDTVCGSARLYRLQGQVGACGEAPLVQPARSTSTCSASNL
jgi:hypothetical protein